MDLPSLRMSPAQRDMMVAHVARWRPEEACGLLGGPPGRVARVYLVENVYHSPVAYLMDPAAQVAAMVEIEEAGWDVVGIFHSHPAGPPVPSQTDVAQALYPDAIYVILAPDGPNGWAMRGFLLDAGQVREVKLEVGE